MKTHFFVYIVECRDGTLYVGSTNNLDKRIREHNSAKSGAHYTKIRRPVELRYFELCESLSAARSREAEIKKLSRENKLLLVASQQIGYNGPVTRINIKKRMAKGNNSQKKEAKKPKKAKK